MINNQPSLKVFVVQRLTYPLPFQSYINVSLTWLKAAVSRWFSSISEVPAVVLSTLETRSTIRVILTVTLSLVTGTAFSTAIPVRGETQTGSLKHH